MTAGRRRPIRPGRPAGSVYVLGAGRVGLGFALALRARGWRVAGVWNRSSAGRRRARRLLGRGVVVEGHPAPGMARRPAGVAPLAPVAGADLVLVSVADAAVPEIGRLLATAPLRAGVVVAHTSGALASTALGLSRLRRAGVHSASLHPLVACVDPEQAARSLPGASFAVEGDAAALRVVTRVVRALGGRAIAIRARDKVRYHASLVMASNLVVALVHLAAREAARTGVRDARVLAALTAGAVELVLSRGTREALTGPVLRGDVATVAGHLAVLRGESRRVYLVLSRVALELARERGLAAEAARELGRVLGAEGQARGSRARSRAGGKRNPGGRRETAGIG